MSSKRKRETEDDSLSTPASKLQKQEEVTRSGRVRKKPSKFDDNPDETEAKPEVAKLPRSPPIPRAQPANVPVMSQSPPPKVVVFPVKQEVPAPVVEDSGSTDDDHEVSKTPSRSSRARKKSAKLLEMEEFEEAEKKHVKKEPAKKNKSPVAGIVALEAPQTPVANKPIPILKIKDIPNIPKIESVSPPGIQVSPQKSPVAGTSKSPILGNTGVLKSPDNKASVIKLLLSSPTQSPKPALSTGSVTQSPQVQETKQSAKKSKGKKGASEKISVVDEKSKIRQVLEMAQPAASTTQSNLMIKQRLNASPETGNVKTESSDSIVIDNTDEQETSVPTLPVPMINKDPKKKISKKGSEADESPFLSPPIPSPNVIHVGPMNIGLEVKQENEAKKKKAKVKSETDIGDEMIHDDFGLDMPEIELGDPGNDSFMEIDEESELMIPEEEVVTTEKPRGGKSAKKKVLKGNKKKTGQIQLGDITTSDGELVMDLPKMKPDDKKKKKEKTAKEDAEAAAKKKRAPTAYMLWCSSNRPRLVNDNPGIDFSTISKTLGEMWSTLSEKDKMVWKRKAKKAAGKGSTLITTGKTGVPKIPGSQTMTTARQMAVATQRSEKNNPALAQALLAAKTVKQPAIDDISTPVKGFGMEPLDVAAHLKIVGESLSIIGMKLQEHRGLIAVQGSLSVLLDSLLCTVAPLMCLTSVLPETNGLPAETHMKNLDNIAYIMPGL